MAEQLVDGGPGEHLGMSIMRERRSVPAVNFTLRANLTKERVSKCSYHSNRIMSDRYACTVD